MNDTRLTPRPSSGPSDQEVWEFIGLFYTRPEFETRVVDPDFTYALVRAALAKWGAPPQPSSGPSDEWLLETAREWLEQDHAERSPGDYERSVADAMAFAFERRRAQDKYDADRVTDLLNHIDHIVAPSARGISTLWLLAQQVRAALARWGAQTEYDPVKVEALLDIIEQKKFNGTGLLEYAAAVRSSRRQKGRVVEGWAVLDENGLPRLLRLNRKVADNLLERGEHVVPCRIEILDAPEEK